MTIGEMITELDTATGMMLVASVNHKAAREAMEKISNVSFELGFLVDKVGDQDSRTGDEFK